MEIYLFSVKPLNHAQYYSSANIFPKLQLSFSALLTNVWVIFYELYEESGFDLMVDMSIVLFNGG